MNKIVYRLFKMGKNKKDKNERPAKKSDSLIKIVLKGKDQKKLDSICNSILFI